MTSTIAPDIARTAAANAFVLAFPLLLADAVRRAHPITFHQFHLVAQDSGALAPGLVEESPTAVLSSAWLDVGEEPVLIRLPNTRGRHLILTLIDSAGETFDSVGSRNGDETGMDIAVVGPNWRGEVPSGVRARRAPSDGVWALSRIYAHSMLDRREALAIARRQRLAKSMADLHHPPSTMPVWAPPPSPCLRQAVEMEPGLFFHRLEAVLERAPAAFQRAVRPRIETLRADLGGPPPASAWTPALAEALAAGLQDAAAAINAAAQAPIEAEEWREIGGDANTGPISPLERAAEAYVGLGAPLRKDVLQLACDRDQSGRLLSGAHAYRIHFPPDKLPPMEAFWRLSCRPAQGHVERRALSDRAELALNSDGSLDLLIQHAAPPADQVSNWLPAPEGALSLAIRLYAPKAAALSGDWRMPSVERLDSGSNSRRGGRWRPPPRTMLGPPRRPETRPSTSGWRTIR